MARMASDAQQLLTRSEAAELLRMTPTRVARLARAQRIPHVPLPDGEIRFVAEDLWDWIRQLRVPGDQE